VTNVRPTVEKLAVTAQGNHTFQLEANRVLQGGGPKLQAPRDKTPSSRARSKSATYSRRSRAAALNQLASRSRRPRARQLAPVCTELGWGRRRAPCMRPARRKSSIKTSK
jgi:hypothetical protein